MQLCITFYVRNLRYVPQRFTVASPFGQTRRGLLRPRWPQHSYGKLECAGGGENDGWFPVFGVFRVIHAVLLLAEETAKRQCPPLLEMAFHVTLAKPASRGTATRFAVLPF